MSDPDTSNNKKDWKDWNAMIYLAGENNLAEECVFALKEMKRARPRRKDHNNTSATDKAADARVKVVAQLDAGGLGGDEVRYVLKRGDTDGELNDDEITRVDTTQTTYRGVLKDFISSSILIKGRARHYLLILSGHGNGLDGDFLSRDIDTPDRLSIPKIRWVLREVKKDFVEKFRDEEAQDFKIDILGLDSCMMSMAEIGFELRGYVNFMVGAEGFEPNSGWPYERIISDLLTKPEIQPDDLAVKIVQRYARYYTDFLPAGRSVDQSVCDLSKCDKLAAAIRKLADELHDQIDDPDTMRQIVLAHWEAQSYKDDQYVDLYDFCDVLDRGPSENPEKPVMGSVVMKGLKVDSKIRAACQEIKEILGGDEPMIVSSRHSGPAVQYSHGLSVYFPWSKVIDSYEDLEFATATNWKRFLDKYVKVTRRAKRPCACPAPTVQVQLVEGQLFNSGAGGFDFILTENKNAPTVSRFLGNRVGSMKNPAIDVLVCDCPEKTAKKVEVKTENNGKPPETQDPKWTGEQPATETKATSTAPVVEPSTAVSVAEPSIALTVAPNGKPGARQRPRKK